jgi:hypothetical protein
MSGKISEGSINEAIQGLSDVEKYLCLRAWENAARVAPLTVKMICTTLVFDANGRTYHFE